MPGRLKQLPSVQIWRTGGPWLQIIFHRDYCFYLRYKICKGGKIYTQSWLHDSEGLKAFLFQNPCFCCQDFLSILEGKVLLIYWIKLNSIWHLDLLKIWYLMEFIDGGCWIQWTNISLLAYLNVSISISTCENEIVWERVYGNNIWHVHSLFSTYFHKFSMIAYENNLTLSSVIGIAYT
jgi:hypothetical protein